VALECAYYPFCTKEAPLSREHVMSRTIYKRVKKKLVGPLQRADKMVSGELKIRDVCKACNNGPLSDLDAYAGKLFDYYFGNVVRAKESISFCFDFGLLSRWLLKVSFNSARVNSETDAHILSAYRPYILTGAATPRKLALFLQLVVPHKLTSREKALIPIDELKTIPRNARDEAEITPCPIRVGVALSKNPRFNGLLCRTVSIFSYTFYILVPKSDGLLQKTWKTALVEFQRVVDGAHRLLGARPPVRIRASRTDFFQSFGYTFHHYASVYRKWLEELDAQAEG
jgi:hypothetical protein